MGDRNYMGLAKFKAFIKEWKSSMNTHGCIEEIFKDSDINYQIPATISFKSEEPEIIGCTALHLALKDYETDSFDQLLNLGADYTIRSGKGMTALHQAIERSHDKSREYWKLKGRLAHPQASLVLSAHVKDKNLTNPCDNHGISHFHIACMLNHNKAVEFFLDGGVSASEDIKANSSRLSGYTPLHIAARYCCLETTLLLLQHGADKNSRNAENMTPLHLLLERRMDIIDHMLTHERAAYDFFKEELDLNDKIVKLFINIEDCSATDAVGLSGFQVACTLQDTALVEKFLEQDIDLDHSISEDSPVWPGYTALHFSVHCNFETVKLLLSRGANVLAKDARGVTPLDLCLKTRNVESLHVVLISAISQLNLETIWFSDGETKLVDLVYAMRSTLELDAFVTASVDDVNVFIPHDSPVWPGYTPLHLAAVLPERKRGIEDLYQTTDYEEEECPRKYYNCSETEEALYEQRIIYLLQAGADVTIRNVDGSTPIHLAFPLKSENTFKRLLNNQWNILNPVDKRGLSHLQIACATLQRPFVERMLPSFCESIDVQTTLKVEYQFVSRSEDEIRKISVSAGSTMLHIAVAAWDFAMIEVLLRHKANIYVQDSLGMTPIHLVLETGELDPLRKNREISRHFQFRELLQSESHWTDCVTDFGLSHLHVASYMDDVDTITKLLDAGANIETTIKYELSKELSFLAKFDSYTPLHMALRKENQAAAETLAERGADCLAREPGDYALLRKSWYESVYSGHLFFASIFKSNKTMQKRLFDCFGWTTLHIACIIRDIDWVKELLKSGADPNALTNSSFLDWSGCSPLHVMSYFVYFFGKDVLRMMELLLDHGADVTLANSKGCTPVHRWFGVSHVNPDGNKYVALLLKYQKDYSVNPINAEGVSHFHAACISGNVAIVEEFLKHGVDVNRPISGFPKSDRDFRSGYTPLHLAMHSGLGDTIDLLLKYGADVNARDCLGNSPLHTAAEYSKDFGNIFIKLVSAGADVHARTLLGATVLEKLASSRWDWKIELLTKYGHRVNSFNPLTQQGLIGLSTLWNSNVPDNYFYKAIIEASDASDLDDMGRTPLHNIVSCQGPGDAMHSFVNAVEGFLNIGYDINCQDEQGRTALHCASSFHNKSGIIGLLGCGADINIMDFNDQTAFTCFLERKSERWDWKKMDIRKIFVEHIYKLNMLNVTVNALNRNAYAETIRKVDLTEHFILECQNELEKSKEITISSLSISLFDFLSSETRVVAAYPYMPLPQRQAINAFFETNQKVFRQEFPHLSCLLYLQYRKALARSELIEFAKYSLNTHLGFDMPDLCSNVIFGFLTNEDLRNLICSEEYCPPRKVQRLA